MSEKDKGNLLAIIDSCIKFQKFTQNIWDADAFFADEKTFDAVLMNFVIIGEAVTRLTEELKDQRKANSLDKDKGISEYGRARLFWSGCRRSLANH